ncbi:MAG TPA: bis(5'-nucleosyl)-tetraphosphatase (symmetrical) YqeK [Clostridiaceae bacterium]
MWKDKDIDDYLKENLKKERYFHSIGVMNSSLALAKLYGADEEKASLAGLIHDNAKAMPDLALIKIAKKNEFKLDKVYKAYPQLLHGFASSIIGRDVMGIEDEDILSAVACHTTGKENMNLLDKIIYIADYIEVNRNFPGVKELRELAFKDLNKAMLKAFDMTLNYVIEGGKLIHPLTIKARNYIIFNETKETEI